MKTIPTALDKVSVRRMLMYVQKSLTELVRFHMHHDWTDKAVLGGDIEDHLFKLNEARAFWNYDFTLVDEDFIFVTIQPRKGDNWIYIEMRATCNISE